jgi:hypothetical protein
MTLSAAEQLLIEMINRARLDPLGEAARFGIDLNEGLAAGTLDGEARQVLAPNQLLHDAAEAHSDWMLATDTFSHTGVGGSRPGDRMADAGYLFEGRYASGENITYRGSTGTIDLDTLMEDYHHKDLFLSSGHRVNMLHDFYREIGVSQQEGVFTSNGRDFNAGIVTENFALSGSSVFVTGVVYTDSDSDGFYSIGEGQANVAVEAGGTTMRSAAAGGYAIELAPAANVTVTLGSITLRVDVAGGNGKLDLVGGDDVFTSVDTTLVSAAGSLTALGVGDINLTGHAGGDLLKGNSGDNVLDGGTGSDTVYYDISQAGVTITRNSDGSIRVQSSEGDDTLVNVETLTFTDRTIDLAKMFPTETAPAPIPDVSTPAGETMIGAAGADAIFGGGFAPGYASHVSEQVFRLYQAALGRAPDAAGHTGWIKSLSDGTQALADVANGFVESKEFKATYGNLGTGDFVDLLYQNVLGRAADADGRAGWMSAIDTGQTTRADAVIGFSESKEFIKASASAAHAATEMRMPGTWTDDVFRLYDATLDRAPDLGGLESWANALATTSSFASVVSGFVQSTEFQKAYGNLDNAGFVDLLYDNVLDRTADAVGRAGWLDVLADGGSRTDVVIGIVQSREFVKATAQNTYDWVVAQGVQDVIEGRAGDDVMAGGLMRDAFVFNALHDGNDTVLDLEAWDQLVFTGFGYADDTAVRAHLAASGNDVVFSDQGVNVVFEHASLDMFTDDMIMV